MSDEERLQEYLDGRMDDAERAQFEAALARDPELAARVRSARQVGGALRALPSDLPEGLIDRARIRFETSVRRPSRPARRIPWEAWGLAAAAVLVAVLLIPRSWEPSSSRALPPADVRQERGESTESRDDARTVENELDRTPAAAEPEPSTVVGTSSASNAQVEDVAREAETQLPPAPPPAARVAAARLEKVEGIERDTRAVGLPAGSLARGSIVIFSSPSDPAWVALLESPAGSAARVLAPDFQIERVVAFGPGKAPFSCRGTSVSPGAGAIVLVPGSPDLDSSESAGGCLVVIPQGNSEVRIEVTPED